MAGSIGPLVAADESFNHQIVETHASVLHSDYSWTEKVCGMACSRDGSLSINFGFGKYVNRNVVDGYCGASRGVEQWTVRASRALSTGPDRCLQAHEAGQRPSGGSLAGRAVEHAADAIERCDKLRQTRLPQD